LKNRPERGDLADEDDALEIAELLEIRESPVYLFKNRCSAAPADANLHCTTNCKGLEQHSSQPVKVSDDTSPSGCEHKLKDVRKKAHNRLDTAGPTVGSLRP
jgi:hypothetical protein